MADVLAFFSDGTPAGDRAFRSEWLKLPADGRTEIRSGFTDRSLTYPDRQLAQ